MSTASPKALDSYPAHGFLAVTRAALGCGIGMMMASKFQRQSTRTNTAIALLSLGVLGNVPWIVSLLVKIINRPESERGMKRRLASIRENAAYEEAESLF